MTENEINLNDREIEDIIRRNLTINTDIENIISDISNNRVVHVDTPVPTTSERMYISTITVPSLNLIRGLTNTPSPLARNINPILGSPCRIVKKEKKNNKTTYPECLCCMDNNFPISKKLLSTCKAEIKHNICYNCFKLTNAKKCLYCFPLEKGNFKQMRNNNFERNYREGLTIVANNYPANLENIIITNNVNSPRENVITIHSNNGERQVRYRQQQNRHRQLEQSLCHETIKYSCIFIFVFYFIAFLTYNNKDE